MEIRNPSRGTVLATRVRWATDASDRMRGLLDRTSFDAGEALVIDPCNSIHMFGMRFPIDAVFLDDADRVIFVHAAIRPWRFTRIHFRARRCVELPAGTCARSGTVAGDQLSLDRP